MASAFPQFPPHKPQPAFIRYQWIDLFGILRVRILTTTHARNLAQSSRYLSVGPAALYYSYVHEPGTVPRAAKSLIEPDWSSLRICADNNQHASVMCYVSEGIENMMWRRDPRTKLTNVVELARSKHNLLFQVGFELEFTLFQFDEKYRTWQLFENVPAWSSMAGLRNQAMSVLQEISLRLITAGIEVQQFHTESARAGFEVVTGPSSPMQAVDALIYSIETVKTVAQERGFKASFFPNCGNGEIGQHIHLSLSNKDLEPSFLAGLLHHLPALFGIGMPNVDSYSRVQHAAGACGTWVSWGTEIRDVPIRKIDAGHLELRFVDGTANMYLALATSLMAGLLGIEKEMVLSIKDAQKSPGSMTASELENHGINMKLPDNLKHALTALADDRELSNAIGEALVTKFLYHKRMEEEIQSEASEEQRRRTCLDYF